MDATPSLAAEPPCVSAAARSHAAFAEFFAATWPDLAGYCETLLRDAVTAEESAQEAMTRVFVRFPLLRDPRGYVFRVATNVVHDHWRHATRVRAVGMVAPADESVPSHADDALLAAVRALPPRLSSVVLLHYYADLRIEDVARLLHRPAGTVKRRLHEARRALAASLEEDR